MTWRENQLTRFIDAILGDRRPRTFPASDDDLETIRAALILRSGKQGADLPSEAFVDVLRHRLRGELEGTGARSWVSRRGLLAGAGAAAAALVAGAVGERLLDRPEQQPPSGKLVTDQSRWQPAVQAAEVHDGRAIRFTTRAVLGFVVNRGGRFTALSAICTHQGCILVENEAEGRLACPCHRTTFSLGGDVVIHQLARAPGPLFSIPARVREGWVEVLVP